MSTLDVCFFFAGASGQYDWPMPEEMLAIAQHFPVSVWKHEGLFATGKPFPPYDVGGSRESLRYLIAGARANGHIACLYTSWFYARQKGLTPTQFLQECRRLKTATGCTGFYIDGLSFAYAPEWPWRQEENRYIMRVLRSNILGRSGTIVLHATHKSRDGTFAAPDLNAEQHANLVVIGEGAPNWDDPEACKEYIVTQIEPRQANGIPWAMLRQNWDTDWLVAHGASAIGHVGMSPDGSGGVNYNDGTRTHFYQRMMASRAALNQG